MHCISKVHENPKGARFTIAFKISSTKQIYKSQNKSFYKNAKFSSN